MMNEKIIMTNNNEMVDERIGKNIFTIVCGMVKIMCGVSLGFVLGIFVIYECIPNISSISIEDTLDILFLISYSFSMIGYMWLTVRGAFQVTSVFKPVKENKSVVFRADVCALIFIAVGCVSNILAVADYTLTNGANMAVFNFFFAMYIISIIITLIDSVCVKRSK